MPSRLLRRGAYLLAVLTACAAFGFTLTAIAGTRGQIAPDGRAAELLRKQQSTEQVRHLSCPHERQTAAPDRGDV